MGYFNDVGEFHKKFGLPVAGDGPPKITDDELFRFRLEFMREELAEFEEGHQLGDLAEVADALADLIYVACGTAHCYGIPLDEVWAEVQRANMQKERAQSVDESKRGSLYDVIKPLGWIPPNVERVLDDYSERFRRGDDREAT